MVTTMTFRQQRGRFSVQIIFDINKAGRWQALLQAKEKHMDIRLAAVLL